MTNTKSVMPHIASVFIEFTRPKFNHTVAFVRNFNEKDK